MYPMGNAIWTNLHIMAMETACFPWEQPLKGMPGWSGGGTSCHKGLRQHRSIHLLKYHRSLWRCQVTGPTHLEWDREKGPAVLSLEEQKEGDEVKRARKGWRWGQGSRECVH